MSLYTVEIVKRPLISFDEYMVSRVSNDLQISVGDKLVQINGQSVETICKSIQYAFKDMLQIFYDQKLPFYATFERENASQPIAECSVSSNDEISFENNDIFDFMHDEISDDEEDVNEQSAPDLIHKYLVQYPSKCKNVYFDKAIHTASNGNICLFSSNGLSDGIHKWTIEILKCDVNTAEIGVISSNPSTMQNIKVSDDGIIKTKSFGARVIYGSELCTSSVYYGSYNADNQRRCFRDLSNRHKVGWCTKDVLAVKLNLKSWNVKFYLNNVNVRKTLSIEPGHTYYPILSFSGNCQYQLVKSEILS